MCTPLRSKEGVFAAWASGFTVSGLRIEGYQRSGEFRLGKSSIFVYAILPSPILSRLMPFKKLLLHRTVLESEVRMVGRLKGLGHNP